MDFIFSVAEYAYNFFYGVFSIFQLSLSELLWLDAVDGVVTLVAFTNIFSKTLVTISLSETIYGIVSIALELISPLFMVLNVYSRPLWQAFLVISPVVVIVVAIVRSLGELFRG